MSATSNSETPRSLLGRLRGHPNDPIAWAEFVAHYEPKIHAWAVGWGLQAADAEDVTQAVLLRLTVKLKDFEYDPTRSFRGWLKTLTHHAWQDNAERNARPGQGSGDTVVASLLDRIEARQSLAECLDEAFDQELFQLAVERVRLRVEPRTWEAFHLLAVEHWSGAAAAQHLGMKTATVFVARSKVQRMLRDEIARIEGAGSDAG
ncbi:RNA polymerase sigma factor [Fimbriiglobus ruber]|uniref:Transcriptional control n=1 Tax=Fimbriiglobus ruber TaxID=1908690 RepID=A0A225ECK8_9BACT|nr:sigma-70 family RNA polymerase sigma factor [Fimbriiglobus ruber]OWK47069.1 transcriptional control [Fimbriiglobus ruber]